MASVRVAPAPPMLRNIHSFYSSGISCIVFFASSAAFLLAARRPHGSRSFNVPSRSCFTATQFPTAVFRMQKREVDFPGNMCEKVAPPRWPRGVAFRT